MHGGAMSDTPNDTTERPPFEETKYYIDRYRQFADYAAHAFISMEQDIVSKLERNDIGEYVNHTEKSVFWDIRHEYWKFKSECEILRQRYDRGEL
jgi:hypothetical protein